MSTKYFGGMDLAQIGTLTAAAIVSLGLVTASAFMVTNSSRFSAISVTQNLYVATTGSDTSNDCQTQVSPCLTPQHAVDVIAASMESGTVNVNLAAGTYTGGIFLYDMLAASSSRQTAATFPADSPNQVNFIGDPTTPSNVTVTGTDSMAGIVEMRSVSTQYSFNGVSFAGSPTASTTVAAFFVEGPQSALTVNNFNINNVSRYATVQRGGHLYFGSGSAGGTLRADAFGFVGNTGAYIQFNRSFNMTLVGSGRTGFFLPSTGARYEDLATAATWTLNANGVGGPGFLQPSGYGTVMDGFFRSGETWNATTTGGGEAFLRIINGAEFAASSGAIINYYASSGIPIVIGDGANYNEQNTQTWTFAGGITGAVQCFQGATCFSANSFSSATVTYPQSSTSYLYGYDGRYLKIASPSSTGTFLFSTASGTNLTATNIFSTKVSSTGFLVNDVITGAGTSTGYMLTASPNTDTGGVFLTNATNLYFGWVTANNRAVNFVNGGTTKFAFDASALSPASDGGFSFGTQSLRWSTGFFNNVTSTNATATNFAIDGSRFAAPNLSALGATGDFVCQNNVTGLLEVQLVNCTVSSIRFKEHVTSMDTKEMMEKTRKLRAVMFDYKNGDAGTLGTSHDQGFIAEEVALIDPYLVAWEEATPESLAQVVKLYPKAVMDRDGKPFIPHTVDYMKISVILSGAIQDLDDRLTSVERRMK